MSEFRFTNDQWRVYQDLPGQGISHRHWLEHVVNSWLPGHDRQVAEKAWDCCVDEMPIDPELTQKCDTGKIEEASAEMLEDIIKKLI